MKNPSKWLSMYITVDFLYANLGEKVQEIREFLPYTHWLANMFIDGSAGIILYVLIL